MSRVGVGADNGAAVAEIEKATPRRFTLRTSSNRSHAARLAARVAMHAGHEFDPRRQGA